MKIKPLAIENFQMNQTNSTCMWLLFISYSMVLVLANWFDVRIISFLNLNTDAGTLIFPFTFLLSNAITEVYGYKNARMAIWLGFAFNILFIVYGQIVIHMPSPDFQTNNIAFDNLFDSSVRVILASTASYFFAEPLNSLVMSKLKMKFNGKHKAFRFLASTVVASFADSFIFGFVAFYGIWNDENLINFCLTMWLIKVFIEFCGLPFSVRLTSYLKKKDQVDIYDINTKYTFFSLERNYNKENNKYRDENDG
ncbi:queuosine precursor transporter [Piscirickettsia litoralis]|uniref:Probable queuosine precursor transporter n=1 Tax=Piscirickettsia litoralis TaxID=1891921 RepID=A0ABX2ZYP9_9GAMM|nr:queuosine precursor transporter [Piscirickettsia litoralis]ODN41137.1 hypothetical protein BGC07_17845 [Piscirickettsia litoralis]